jgi:putative tryptophan/tyrosine transport system substrate-binding protein
MTAKMKRRQFITLLGGAAAWPLAARAEKPAMPVVGFLHIASLETRRQEVASFYQGLKDIGYVEGQNVAIEYRWGENHNDRMPTLAADLVRLQVDVIAALSTPSILVAKAATTTIPTVFLTNGDPVKFGLVASLNRPGGNITGITLLGVEVVPKRFELLHKVVPRATKIGVLANPTNPQQTESETREARDAAHSLGLELLIVNASNESEIDSAFATLVQRGAHALFVIGDALFTSRREQLVSLAARNAIPTIFTFREFALAGGLISYGSVLVDVYRQAGVYVGRILKGTKPADLPVVQAAKLELVINLKTARALGLDLPPTVIALADEVIE